MGFHFVAFSSDNNERAKAIRAGRDCAELLRKNGTEPRNAMGGTKLQ